MKQLTRKLVFHAKNLGLPWVVGLALIIWSVWYGLFVLLPASDRLHALQRQAHAARSGERRQVQGAQDTPWNSPKLFYNALPGEREAPRETGKILAAAFDAGFDPEKVEYAMARDPDAAFSRYQVTIPVTGPYRDIRSFEMRVLNEIPSAALSEISLRREDALSPVVTARLRFTLYLQRQS